MNFTGLVMILLGGLFIAFYTILTKNIFNNVPDWKDKSGLFVSLTSFIAILALACLIPFTGGLELKSGWLLPAVITGILNIFIQYSIVRAKALEEVSLVTPIYSTTPAVVILTSIIILGEYPTFWGWVGIWLMVIGTYLLNIQDFFEKKKSGQEIKPKDYLAPFLLLGKSKGVRFAFLAAFLASISLNFDALAYRRANVAFAGVIVFGITAVFNFLYALKNKEIEGGIPKISWKIVLTSIIFCGAIWFSSAAFRYGITPYVGTLKRIYIPLVIVFAFIFLKEKIGFKNRLFGGILIAIGATLISVA